MTDLRSLFPEELQAELAPFAVPAFRARQMFAWLQAKGAGSAMEMTNLPLSLREALARQCFISACEIARKQVSGDGTVKYLFRLHDGQTVESVVMQYEHGRSVCVSSQVGCKMGCVFCASGAQGFVRNLLAGEMLAQVAQARRDTGQPVTHIVLMGMGEPLDNYDNVLRFLRLAANPEGLHIGMRKISLSTCGLVPELERLAGEHLGLTLSVSLHAPNNALRRQFMPVASRYSLEELLESCKRYTARTSRRISFEYALFCGVNDSKAQASELAARLRGMLCHVNLIPANPTGLMARSSKETVQGFQERVTQQGIACTVRRSLGQDISAACGQLRQEAGPLTPNS
jgi:23S rRNA (adenine2503-C2)-methyltransferase